MLAQIHYIVTAPIVIFVAFGAGCICAWCIFLPENHLLSKYLSLLYEIVIEGIASPTTLFSLTILHIVQIFCLAKKPPQKTSQIHTTSATIDVNLISNYCSGETFWQFSCYNRFIKLS